jgi:hypothetical protein
MEENSLNIIIPRMADGNAIGPDFRGSFGKEGIPHFTSGFFKGETMFKAITFDIALPDSAGQAECIGEPGNIRGITVRFSTAKTVIAMGNVKRDTEFFFQFREDFKQADRVRPARYGYNKAGLIRYTKIFPEKAENPLLPGLQRKLRGGFHDCSNRFFSCYLIIPVSPSGVNSRGGGGYGISRKDRR